jgi:hypothetical protein
MELAATVWWPNPPGKWGLPVTRVIASAAARENVLWPEMYPGKAGVLKVLRWKGSQSLASCQRTRL